MADRSKNDIRIENFEAGKKSLQEKIQRAKEQGMASWIVDAHQHSIGVIDFFLSLFRRNQD